MTKSFGALIALALSTLTACTDSEDALRDEAPDGPAFIELDDVPPPPESTAALTAAGMGAERAVPGVTSAEALPLFTDRVAGDPVAGTGKGISLGFHDETGTTAGDGGLGEALKRTPDASYAACETARAARAFYADLAAIDARLCAFRTTLAALGARALDGHTHAVRLPAGGEGAADHARFRVLRAGLGGPLVDVTVDLCAAGRQVAHARYELGDTSLVLAAKATRNQAQVTYTAHAALGPDGRLAGVKKLTVDHREPGRTTLAEATQTASELVLSRAGEVRLFADVDLIDANAPGARYALANLALGDGAALIVDGAATLRQGWSGDTWEATDAVTQSAGVQDMKIDELLTAPGAPAKPGFDRDEAYGCDLAEDLVVEGLELDAARCPDVALPQGRIDCRSVTPNSAERR